MVEYGPRRSVLELKLRRGAQTEEEGLRQLSAYLDRLGEPEGFLVIFDRRKRIPWDNKIYIKEAAGLAGQRVHVFGM